MEQGSKSRIAVVTGGAGGLGQAFAERLAGAGHRVVVIDRLLADETVGRITDAGNDAVAIQCDLADRAAVESAVATIIADQGGCDVLVNNAAIASPRPFDSLDYDAFRRTLAVNLEAPFLFAKGFAPGMRERAWGRIINIAASNLFVNIAGLSDYITSKGGVWGLTRALASDLGEFGITVNAVAPGLIRTPLTIEGRPGHPPIPDEMFAHVAAMQAIKRSGVPADLAGMVAFLASDDASYITAQMIVIDGGMVRH